MGLGEPEAVAPQNLHQVVGLGEPEAVAPQNLRVIGEVAQCSRVSVWWQSQCVWFEEPVVCVSQIPHGGSQQVSHQVW